MAHLKIVFTDDKLVDFVMLDEEVESTTLDRWEDASPLLRADDLARFPGEQVRMVHEGARVRLTYEIRFQLPAKGVI